MHQNLYWFVEDEYESFGSSGYDLRGENGRGVDCFEADGAQAHATNEAIIRVLSKFARLLVEDTGNPPVAAVPRSEARVIPFPAFKSARGIGLRRHPECDAHSTFTTNAQKGIGQVRLGLIKGPDNLFREDFGNCSTA